MGTCKMGSLGLRWLALRAGLKKSMTRAEADAARYAALGLSKEEAEAEAAKRLASLQSKQAEREYFLKSCSYE